jgi:hypothetical protein
VGTTTRPTQRQIGFTKELGGSVEVPEAIKNASESTVATLSHIVDDVKDRIDTGILHRHPAPPPKKHTSLKALLLLALVGLVMTIVAQRVAKQ